MAGNELNKGNGNMASTNLRRMMGIALFAIALGSASAQGQEIKVTLLGTGSPAPVIARFGPSTLVEAGGQKYLFDAGRGAMQRLNQIKVKWQDVQGVFLTHLHSDHVVGFPDLWLTGWLVGPGRNIPLPVRGPRGTVKMMSLLEQAFDYDLRVRPYVDRAVPEGAVILAEDIGEGVALEKGGVKITAFEVDHTGTPGVRLSHRLFRALGRAVRRYPRLGESHPLRPRRGSVGPRSGCARSH
jgi:ribonuclease Z